MSAIAQALAPAADATAQQASQYLTFLLGTEPFAIGILGIKEIIEYGEITSVPMMPACVRGVINLRGAVVPVLDLQARFGRSPSAVTKRTCIVIVEIASEQLRQVVGIVVDAVSEVLDIPESDIEPPPPFGTRIRADFIRGMGKVRGKFVILLDVHKVASFDEIDAIAAAAQNVAEVEAAA
jgi:purine-binding chemotaxis protein CheW